MSKYDNLKCLTSVLKSNVSKKKRWSNVDKKKKPNKSYSLALVHESH
jgi:hypothetical protein